MARISNSDEAFSSEEEEERVKDNEEEDEEELEAVARSSGSDDDEAAAADESPVSDGEAAPVEDDYEVGAGWFRFDACDFRILSELCVFLYLEFHWM